MVITINPSMKNEAMRQHQACLAGTLVDALQAAPQVALDAVIIPVSGCQEAQASLSVHRSLIFMYLQMTPPRSFPIRLCHPSALASAQ